MAVRYKKETVSFNDWQRFDQCKLDYKIET